VILVAHTNNGICSSFMFRGRRFMIVEIKFNAPRILLTPARCNEKIARSTDDPL